MHILIVGGNREERDKILERVDNKYYYSPELVNYTRPFNIIIEEIIPKEELFNLKKRRLIFSLDKIDKSFYDTTFYIKCVLFLGGDKKYVESYFNYGESIPDNWYYAQFNTYPIDLNINH